MKKYICLLFAIATTLFASVSFAYVPPTVPANGFYISDQAGKLTTTELTQLNQKIERVNKATKNEFGILLLQDMGGDDIEDVANATFKSWGVGKKGLDNGCLIVVALKERKTRIETGKGITGEITDIQANDILRKNLAPHLKAGDFAGGLNETLDALSSLMESRHNQKAEARPSAGCDVNPSGASAMDGNSFIVLFLAGMGFVALMLSVRILGRHKAKKELIQSLAREAYLRKQNNEEIEKSRVQNELYARKLEEEAGRQADEDREAYIKQVEARAKRPSTLPPPPSRKKSAPPLPLKAIREQTASATAIASALLVAQEAGRRRRELEEDEKSRKAREDERRAERERERSREDDTSTTSTISSFDIGSDSSDSGSGFGGGDSEGSGSSSDF